MPALELPTEPDVVGLVLGLEVVEFRVEEIEFAVGEVELLDDDVKFEQPCPKIFMQNPPLSGMFGVESRQVVPKGHFLDASGTVKPPQGIAYAGAYTHTPMNTTASSSNTSPTRT